MGLRTTLSVLFPRVTEAFEKKQQEWITSFLRVLDDTLRNIRLDLGDMDFSADITALEGDVVDIDNRLELLEAKSFLPCRQTVCASKLDSEGKPAFLSINGNNVDILASDSPLVMGFAEGFNQNGALDYIKRLTADVSSAFTGFQGLAPNYLYAMLANDGTVSYGHTPYQPQYGHAFNPARYSLLHFDGTNGSTTITDDWGNTWTASDNARLSTADKKFGGASLYLDGSGDFISTVGRVLGATWTMDMWLKPTNFSAVRIISRGIPSGYQYFFAITTSGTIQIYASSNGSSWDLINGLTTSNALTVNAWNHVPFTHDGSLLRVYINGTLGLGTALTGKIFFGGVALSTSGIRIGAAHDGSYGFLGYIDEVRILNDAVLFGGNFSVPTAPYTRPDVPFFSIPEMKMYKGTNSGLAAWRALFLGEAVTNSVGTPTSVTCYALNGQAVSGEYFGTAGTNIVFADEVGCEPKDIVLHTRQADNYAWSLQQKLWTTHYYGVSPVSVDRNRSMAATFSGLLGHPYTHGLSTFANASIPYAVVKFHVKRWF